MRFDRGLAASKVTYGFRPSEGRRESTSGARWIGRVEILFVMLVSTAMCWGLLLFPGSTSRVLGMGLLAVALVWAGARALGRAWHGQPWSFALFLQELGAVIVLGTVAFVAGVCAVGSFTQFVTSLFVVNSSIARVEWDRFASLVGLYVVLVAPFLAGLCVFVALIRQELDWQRLRRRGSGTSDIDFGGELELRATGIGRTKFLYVGDEPDARRRLDVEVTEICGVLIASVALLAVLTAYEPIERDMIAILVTPLFLAVVTRFRLWAMRYEADRLGPGERPWSRSVVILGTFIAVASAFVIGLSALDALAEAPMWMGLTAGQAEVRSAWVLISIFLAILAASGLWRLGSWWLETKDPEHESIA